jgi:microcystin-dependent protein
MSNPFIGEIRLTPYTFTINGWASCNGQLVPIDQNDALFALIGTTYGGDGAQTFALPNLQSRIPVGQGQGPGLPNYVIGQAAGTETITVITTQMPRHTHAASAAATAGTTTSPANAVWAGSPMGAYTTSASPSLTPMSPILVGASGNTQPHENRMPYLALNFQIALFGVFPSRT